MCQVFLPAFRSTPRRNRHSTRTSRLRPECGGVPPLDRRVIQRDNRAAGVRILVGLRSRPCQTRNRRGNPPAHQPFDGSIFRLRDCGGAVDEFLRKSSAFELVAKCAGKVSDESVRQFRALNAALMQ